LFFCECKVHGDILAHSSITAPIQVCTPMYTKQAASA
jgi:hypothetical protein